MRAKREHGRGITANDPLQDRCRRIAIRRHLSGGERGIGDNY